MSLSSILRESKTREFLKPYIHAPKMDHRPAPVVTSTSNPSRMGTAVDYALRFGLQARVGYPDEHPLVARGAVGAIESDPELHHHRDAAKAELEGALEDVADFTTTTELPEHAARGCLRLAGLDTIFRAGLIDELVSPPDEAALTELQALYRLIPWDDFRPQQWGVLNPRFGMGSHLVGGADADVLFDGCLVDIKTVGKTAPALKYVRQLVCYALLGNRYGVSDGPAGARIDSLGIYFARAGYLFRFPLDACIDAEDHDTVVDHLEERGGHLR